MPPLFGEAFFYVAFVMAWVCTPMAILPIALRVLNDFITLVEESV